ncbi:hypothetical protein SAMN05443252_11410 [Bacillus sp. OV322]|uniref:hypothetical protein n=1 Tax=Bacillus sp. OV322 TaxID=1882764 RepID=UPI0008EFE2DF|nr:hypothetical protein [Bacillus sp. OV322]SFD02198.1 hypothetical protein SAMN05443252_11410 [Bacillus sp. OV322]
MFVAYTDASIQHGRSFLSFVIEFENGNVVRKRIAIDETSSNMAEALAVLELTSFLSYYNFFKGILFLDLNAVINSIRGKRVKGLEKYSKYCAALKEAGN